MVGLEEARLKLLENQYSLEKKAKEEAVMKEESLKKKQEREACVKNVIEEKAVHAKVEASDRCKTRRIVSKMTDALAKSDSTCCCSEVGNVLVNFEGTTYKKVYLTYEAIHPT